MSRNLQLQVVLNAIDKATGPIKAIMNSSSGLGKQLKETRDQLKGLQSQQSNIQSFKALKAASEQSKQAMSEQQQKVKELAAGMRQAEVPTKAMTKEFQAATREAHRLKQNHAANSQQLQVLRSRLNEAGVSTRKAKDGTGGLGQAERDLKSRIDATNKSLIDQKKRLAAVGAQQTKLSQAKAQYERTTKLASSMTTAGAGAMAAGGGVLYGGARLLQEGMQFDATMSKVQAMSGLEKSDEQMKMLRDQAKQLGAETMFSATDAARGQAFLAIAGFTPKSIQAAMPGLLDMALAGDIDLGRTADIASNILGGFKLDSSEMGRVADVLTKAFTSSNTSLESLGETMKYVAPVAKKAGISLEATAAMAGLLGNVGIQGSQAGTSLKSMILNLSGPASTGQKALKKLGIAATDSAGDLRKPEMILADLAKVTEKFGSAKQIDYLKQIFGKEPAAAMAELMGEAGLGGLQEYIRKVQDNNAVASKTAKTMADNLVGDLDELSSAWDGLKLDIFEEQNADLRKLTQSFTDVIGMVATWAQSNPELVATIIKSVAVLAAMVAVGGALMLTIGSILGPLAMMKYGLTVLGIKGGVLIPVIKGIGSAMMVLGKALLANPIFIAIALLAVAAYLIYKNWAPIKEFFINLWGGVSNYLSGVWDNIKTEFNGGIGGIFALLVNWSPLGLFYKAMAGVLSYFGVELPGTFSEFGSGIISSLLDGFSAAWSGIAGFFTDRFEDIKTAFGGGLGGIGELILNWSPLGLFYQVFAGVMDYFGIDLPGKFSEFGAMIMQGLVTGIKNAAGAVKDAVVGMGDSVGGWFKDKLGIKSPSRVFMQFGDDTAEGLALGIAANKDSPLKQVAGMAKQVAAAGTIALSVGVTPAMADNKNISQKLQPATLPIIQDQQQAIRQNLTPVAQPEIQDQQQRILQSLQPVTLPAIQDQQQAIRQSLQPVTHEQQALPALTQNIQQMIISAKQVLPDLTQRIISVFSGPSSAAPEAQKKLFNDQPSIRFDTRAPIGKPVAPQQSVGGNTIHYHISVSGGSDPKELADEVLRQIEAYDRQKQVRTRSRFGDLD